MNSVRPRKGNIWVLSAKGLQNEFVRTMYVQYDMKNLVPAKWVLAGYVVEIPEDEVEQKEEEQEESEK